MSMHTYSITTDLAGQYNQPGVLQIDYGIQATPGRSYFSVSGRFYPGLTEDQINDDLDPDIAGMIHPEILTAAPWLADLVSAHLCDAVTGEPMHATDNAWYWYRSALDQSAGPRRLPDGYADHDAAGRAACYLGCSPELFADLGTDDRPQAAIYAEFAQRVQTLAPAWRLRATYLRQNYRLELPAEHVPAPEPAEHAYQISLGGESVRQEVEDAYQYGNNPHGHTLDEVELLTGLTDTEIGQVINNNVSDDFWQAYDSARHDIIETLTQNLRENDSDEPDS